MPVCPEVQRSATHLARSLKAGLSPLWAVIAVAVALVGGSVAITVAWGVKHLDWGLVIALLLLVVVIAEGSYRTTRRLEKGHAEQLAAAKENHHAMLEAAQVPESSATSDVPPPTGLDVVIDDEILTPFPGIGRILEVEFHVTNRDPVPHSLSLSMSRSGPSYSGGPADDPDHMRFLQTYGTISGRRRGEQLPPRVRPGETVRRVYVVYFAWDPLRRLPDYTLIISDGRQEYGVRPLGAGEEAPAGSGGGPTHGS